MLILVWLISGATTVGLMELWAALLHHRVWHRGLWWMHITHHRRRGDVAHRPAAPVGPWELNDALSCVHAPVAIALILYGCLGRVGLLREVAYGVGLGMTCYGMMYVLVHDGLAHRRLPLRWLLRFRYMRAVRAAHGLHHRTGGPPYGMFLGPWHPTYIAHRSKGGRRL